MKKIKHPLPLNPQLQSLVSTYWQWRNLWIATTIVFFGLGIAYSILLKKDTWVASQAIIVRDEATGAVMRLGRFESQTQMKAAQETVLEMARNPQVVEAALTAVGRPAKFFGLFKSDSPPSKSEIEDFAGRCVSVRAPRGAELGTTEVIYLDVKQNSRDRAIQLASEICNALEKQLKVVRFELASGVVQELEAAKAVCQTSLSLATNELKLVEVEAGSDLADLRGLTDSAIGSTNRLMLDMVRDELRKADLSIKTITPNVQLARAALDNPPLVLQAADVLAESHPVIQQLRTGYSEAAVKTARLEGTYSKIHPEVLNARKAEDAIRENIRRELQVIVDGYEASIAITQQKINALNLQEQELGQRLNRLAELRARYGNLAAEVKARNDKLSSINNELTETQAARDAAQVASLLTRLDTPVLGEKPVGPGRTTIVGGATVGGLMFGLGVVFLLVPLDGRVSGSQRSQFESEIVRSQTARNESPIVRNESPTPGNESTNVRQEPTIVSNSVIQPVPSLPAAKNETVAAPPHNALSAMESHPATKELASNPDPMKAVDLALAKAASSATAAAQAMQQPKTTDSQPYKPRRVDSLDEVRSLISSALKNHTDGGAS